MAVIRWEPARELQSVQSEINRLFNTLFDTPTPASAGPATGPRRWIPPMDLVETEAEFVLTADLPGLSEADVTIELQDNVLTVAGERTSDHEEHRDGVRRIERSSGRFSRSLTLPEGVDPEAISASFERGVLEVHVPKPQVRRPQRITIAVTGGGAETIDAGETGAESVTEPAPAAA